MSNACTWANNESFLNFQATMLNQNSPILFMCRRLPWAGPSPINLLRLGLRAQSRKGKQRLTELAVLLRLQPEPLRLFIHASVCLFKEKQIKKKIGTHWQEQSKFCHWIVALQIEGNKHNVVYIWAARLRGWSGGPLRHARLEMEQIARGSDFRLKMLRRGLCVVMSQVTPTCSDKPFKQKDFLSSVCHMHDLWATK